MSQSDLSNVTRLGWEISNFQYYPDDSAPPVPNSNLASVEENSLPFSDSYDPVSYAADGRAMSGITDLTRFTGTPNATKFDYRSGITEIEIDHIFYSYLNVDVNIPYRHIDNNRFEHMYTFRDFIPALCGLYSIEVPAEGHHLGYWMNIDGPAQSEYSFGIDSLGKLMYTRAGLWRILNQYPASPRDFNQIDFVFDLESIGLSDSPTLFKTTNYELSFVFAPGGGGVERHFTIDIKDLGESGGDWKELAVFPLTAEQYDLKELIVVRLDFITQQVHLLTTPSDTSLGESRLVTHPFNNMPIQQGFSIVEYTEKPTIMEGACQIIGYNVDTSMEELYVGVLRPKKYWQDPIWDQDIIESEEFVLPPYQGNAWDYLNKFYSLYPFRRFV